MNCGDGDGNFLVSNRKSDPKLTHLLLYVGEIWCTELFFQYSLNVWMIIIEEISGNLTFLNGFICNCNDIVR